MVGWEDIYGDVKRGEGWVWCPNCRPHDGEGLTFEEFSTQFPMCDENPPQIAINKRGIRMNTATFQTLRHMETVRNYLNAIIIELMSRQETHDQSKLQDPEVATFEEFSPKLAELTYGSDEYYECLKQMKPALDHHNQHNRHHPEHHKDGINGMNLIDLIEMMCDWKAASLRHNNGDLAGSVMHNAKRFGYDEQLRTIMMNTASWIEDQDIYHFAEES